MAKFEVKNSEGKKVAEAELAAEVYGIEPNIHVMHHIVKCQMASWRQGTQSAKGRSEVSGGGKKPWRQKGTGRARQGSIRAAQWRHGGVVFAPKPRSYAKRMNNKEVKLAMRSALSAKLADGELVLVDDYGFEKPSTKAAVAMLKALGLEPTAVSFAETFNALQQGVVDGQEGCFNNVVTLKFYEAQKYATMRTSTPTCRSATFPRRSSSPPTRPTPTTSSTTTPC
jgi:large subunit ribosomal protein L4